MNLFKKAKNFFAGLLQANGQKMDLPSKNEMRLEVDEWQVKQKLGKSFFTRQLRQNTRNARIASLNKEEFELAQQRGWVL